ncbi:MAG TPA: hypothetical protein VJN43_11390 [Bryobacteraceae bacterium]|nr:hypothetical protein [Bryobacteraceae bacterium]
MPEIERVLTQGGSSPKDFTLHDACHGFRVTEWMTQIIPGDVLKKLSANELALLLLSAYLHDIGMTPQWGKVSAHKEYLISDGTMGFSGDELESFQQWLAEREGINFEPPVKTFQKMEELVTYYCRSRHNDWSAEWISAKIPAYHTGLYQGWVEDLILICKSHHQGYEELAGPRFDPRDLGANGVVHRRYLAAVLRVADILENDPERTPDVILRHHAVTATSEPYWLRNQYLNQQLADNRILISATPPTALLYKAIEETVSEIQEELVLCDRLKREHPFDVHPVSGAASLPHRWVIEPSVGQKILEGGGRYEYIQGAFRPNTKKVLELLTGTELYGDYLAAVRELLQNAFDAVKEQIARVQLKRKRFDSEYRNLLSREHSVTMLLEVSGGQYKLICRDTGVGMSKKIIKDYLLVSGESSNPELTELQLQCKKSGVALERLGQFGIGVLSYFMLADHVVFKTRRSQETGTQEARGWEFETWGVGSFGELRTLEGLPHGTEVQLDPRPDVVTKVTKQVGR